MGELDAALKRLDQALDAAETAIGRALDAADSARAREEELTAFADDRIRLIELLDVSAAQAQTANAAREAVSARLEDAIAAVEDVLAESEG